MTLSRRLFLRYSGVLGASALLAPAFGAEAGTECRKYHLSISSDALQANPVLLEAAQRAGVSAVWLTGFLYGHWHYSLERLRPWRQQIEKLGMAAHCIHVPLGHPGDSLGAKSGDVPLTPPRHWRLGTRPDGSTYAGTSLHEPATEENCEAMRKVQAAGIEQVFLDDDFRLAQAPGAIGGCFCAEHKREFLRLTGYGESQWAELLDAVGRRQLSAVLRAWVDFTCDQLTASFRAQQKAAPRVRLGNMVMYLGAEKAGIRLADYRDAPFRVGELMFDNNSFAPVKGKTDELFSSLFHRRFARAELAYSETTAYPADRLSAANMAAKLAVSTISDVRSTMFMSGLTAFPAEHWQTLGPAMKRHAALHRRIAGHAPRGPLKHFFGEASRYVGDDRPFSLFLALGVPFEVTSQPATNGYTFLSDADALAVGALRSPGTVFIARPQTGLPEGLRTLPESLAELFAWKRQLLPQLADSPYIEEDIPMVCAWYPTARAAILWNLTEQRAKVTLRFGDARRSLSIDGLDAALVEDLGG